MSAPNVIPFPKNWHLQHADFSRGPRPAAAQPPTAGQTAEAYAHSHGRRHTVRFMGPPRTRQMPLPLPSDSTLDQRIAAVKATIAGYEDLAARTGRPVSAGIYEGYARAWEKRLAALLEQKRALATQPDLPTLG